MSKLFLENTEYTKTLNWLNNNRFTGSIYYDKVNNNSNIILSRDNIYFKVTDLYIFAPANPIEKIAFSGTYFYDPTNFYDPIDMQFRAIQWIKIKNTTELKENLFKQSVFNNFYYE